MYKRQLQRSVRAEPTLWRLATEYLFIRKLAPRSRLLNPLYRGDFAAVEKLALEAAAHEPERAEACKLAGDAAYGAALAAFDHGDYNTARSAFDRAASFYAQASEVARSDASLYEAMAGTWLQCGEIDRRQGRSSRASIEHALDAIEHALRADPDDGRVYTTKGVRAPARVPNDGAER